MPPPPFLFRIDEVVENRNMPYFDQHGQWIPSTNAQHYTRRGGGASGTWWYCTGQQIQALPHGAQPPPGAEHYKTFSMFYSTGFGFWVLRGDTTNTTLATEAWRPLRFDYEDNDTSTYVTNAGTRTSLNWTRPDQQWPRLLFPDIYHNLNMVTRDPRYGGLKGDLPIFLALIAFSMAPNRLMQMLPRMFAHGSWRIHSDPSGRNDRRGVVVYVCTAPNSNMNELRRYEDGFYHCYYR